MPPYPGTFSGGGNLRVSCNQCTPPKIRRPTYTIPTIIPKMITMPRASDSAFCRWLQGMMVFSK